MMTMQDTCNFDVLSNVLAMLKWRGHSSRWLRVIGTLLSSRFRFTQLLLGNLETVLIKD